MKDILNYSSIENEILNYIEKSEKILIDRYNLYNLKFLNIGMNYLKFLDLILWVEKKYNISFKHKKSYFNKDILSFIELTYSKILQQTRSL